MKYAGLTDNPWRRKQEHGDPSYWWQRSFSTEDQARKWEKDMLAQPEYTGGAGGDGWHYGYIYTISASTRE